MLRRDTIAFLQNVSPFDLLPRSDLEGIVEEIGFEYFPRGTHILSQGGAPSENLYVVKKGAVRVYLSSETGDEINIDYRSEGEHFGLLSLIGGDRSRNNVLAIEDTIAYAVPKKSLQEVLTRNPSVSEHFLKSFFISFIDKTQEETRKRFSGLADGEKALLTTPVGDLVRRDPVVVEEGTSIRVAAGIMAGKRRSSLLVVDGKGAAAGIVTDRDLREKVVATGLDLSLPVGSIMSAPIIDIDIEEQCFEALVRMMRRNIHHLLVVEGGRPKGVLTNHDLLVLQGSSPMLLVKEVEGVQDLRRLGDAAAKINRTVATLLREGARARNISVIITELTEKLLNRAGDLAERSLGPSPVPYALFLYGDGGRRELTLRRPLSIGVVFEGSRKADRSAAIRWFDELRKALGEALPACTFSPGSECLVPEDILSLEEWTELFAGWAESGVIPRVELADMRSFRGEIDLVRRARSRFLALVQEHLELLDEAPVSTDADASPLGFYRDLVVEKSGEHREDLDLYRKGVLPLVDAVRILALREGVGNSSTWGRLQELRKRGFEYAEEAEHALEYLFTLMLHHQLNMLEEGETPCTVIDTASLSSLERKTLKETFQLTSKLQELLNRGHSAGVGG